MATKSFPLFALCLCGALTTAQAQNLYGGAPSSNGLVPQLDLTRWTPGETTDFVFSDLPAGVTSGFVGYSPFTASITLPVAFSGTLMIDPFAAVFVPAPAVVSAPLPLTLEGDTLFMQGVILDPSLGAILTDATQVNFFDPKTVVNTGSTMRLVDEVAMTFGGASSGVFGRASEFTPDRTRLYVTAGDTLTCYDVTGNGLSVAQSIVLTGTARHGMAVSRDGTLLWIPQHNGVAEYDIEPSSPSYNTEVDFFVTPLTGAAGAGGGSGPIAVDATPDNSKLLIAYGEAVGIPNPGTVGIIDRTAPGTPHTIIPVTLGGDLLGVHEFQDVLVSEDGAFAYVLDYGINPSLNGGGITFVHGYANGALINVIDIAAEAELLTIATDGFAATKLGADILDENLWVAHLDHNDFAEAVRIDTDINSPTLWQVVERVQLRPHAFSSESHGPSSIAVTPDGSTVLTAVASTGNNPQAEILKLDTVTGTVTVLNSPSNWPDALATQRY